MLLAVLVLTASRFLDAADLIEQDEAPPPPESRNGQITDMKLTCNQDETAPPEKCN